MSQTLFLQYFRLFSSRRCARCGTGLCASELVMRARDLVFHISCFSCILCGAQLSTGDTAAIRGGRVFCGDHYDTDVLRWIIKDISYINKTNITHMYMYKKLPQTDLKSLNHFLNSESNSILPSFFSSSPQKGRPRKRKTAIQPHNQPADMSRGSALTMGKYLSIILQEQKDARAISLVCFANTHGSHTPKTRWNMHNHEPICVGPNITPICILWPLNLPQ